MSALNDLISQIQDEGLRDKIQNEADKLAKQKKFGLVFESHLPECTPLYDIKVRKGSQVALRNGNVNELYSVIRIENDKAYCLKQDKSEGVEVPVDDLVCVAKFGEAIYPYLKPIDCVCNAPDSDLWHTLIEADNFHALQLMEYLYAGKVDCIYIDPPYNSGAKDWKYNNNYVDGRDAYRHSKWLSMMEKRLRLAKKLLNPQTGVLIVTIDEHEMHHLRTLLEEIFVDYYIQMTTDVVNPKGVTQGRFSRVEEYNIFCFASNAYVPASDDNLLNPPIQKQYPRWKGLLRSGTDARREDREKMFYPILIDDSIGKIVGAGEYLPLADTPNLSKKINGYAVAWPIRKDGSLGRWSVGYDTLNTIIAKGYVQCGGYDTKRKTYAIKYISKPNQQLIEDGKIIITDRDKITGVVKVEYASSDNRVIKTVWHRKSHDAGAYGSDLLTAILKRTNPFPFPKSLYSVHDSIASIVRDRKEALIVDFFAGSGTTLHAINLMNAEDNGKRRCILVTNNAVSAKESILLTKQGLKSGDSDWEKIGIARYITWPRTVCSIEGHDINGNPLTDNYFTSVTETKEKERNVKQIKFVDEVSKLNLSDLKELVFIISQEKLPKSLVSSDCKFVVSDDPTRTAAILIDENATEEFLEAIDGMEHITDFYIITKNNKAFKEIKASITELLGNIQITEPITLPMSDGLKANAAFFKLGFLDKTAVALGMQFKEMLPTLWMKAGAHGRCPSITDVPEDMLILPENKIAILINENAYSRFEKAVNSDEKIDTAFIITDYESNYRSMIKGLNVKATYQLYRDYLDNFRINYGRN